ncbi:DUF4192 domain-containing protein [Nocardia xishanensis]|uniref:DUF4192 domain-containing protein n=1 Tax=Nocardia xishanensis TaxID=238964 RepID=UPI000A031BB7|nr:DUF4192 domain-containing protein [Nocardia xishanensis]
MTTPANPPRDAGARRGGGESGEPAGPPARQHSDSARIDRRPQRVRPRLCLRPSFVGSRTRRTGEEDDPAAGVLCGQPSPVYRGGYSARPLRVDDPGELIAAVPAMVGFYPSRSLVVAVLGPSEPGASPAIAAVLRFDLEPEGGRRGLAASFAALIGQICAAERATEVLAVIVDDRAGRPARKAQRGARSGAAGRALIGALAERLGADGIRIGGAWAVAAIEEGRPWWSLSDRSEGGAVPDPSASTVALAHVLDGRPILRSRSELTDRVAVDAALCAEVGAELDSAVAVARDRFARAVRHDELPGYRRRSLEHVLWQVANIESGALLTAPEIAEIVAALRDRVVRDAMFALAAGDHAAAAERLWLTLARGSSGSDRAEFAALLGYSAYLRGDGPFAGIALEAALDADPSNAMAILLETALRAGMRPEQLRRLARSGYATAAWLGVDLGPMIR